MTEKSIGDEGNKDPPPSLGKVRLSTLPSKSGSCPFHNWVYIVFGSIILLYAIYLVDKDNFKEFATSIYMGHVYTVFQFIENYSPFHEIQETDDELLAKLQRMKGVSPPVTQSASGERLFSLSELTKYDGTPKSPGLYLALLGVVYDVSKGAEYYGPGKGYGFFSGKDGSRAFVSGQFTDEGLVDDVSGLSSGDYLGLEEWQIFYEKDYTRVGLLVGTFYNQNGEVTDKWKELQTWIESAKLDRDNNDVEKKMFPPCNVEWTQADGSRYWCTKKSGGVKRVWVGVPRRLYYPGREPRCACVRTTGAPSTDPSDESPNRGDLDNPHLKEYTGCSPSSYECRNKE